MNKSKYLISVIIPTYNCEHYIINAVNSVLAQSLNNYEIIIVDDGSSDNTKYVLSDFIESEIVKYFYQKNTGPSAARNRGLKEANGKYIAFLDADDLWFMDKLEKSLDFLEKNNFDWICTSMIKINKDGTTFIKRIPSDSFVLDFKTKEIKQLKNGLFFFGSIAVHTPTIIAKKDCFDKVGSFDESFLVCEDTDLWLRFEEAGLRGGYLDEPLTIYRYNKSGLTKGGKIDTLEEGSKVAKKHAYILGIGNKNIRNSYADYLWQVADIYFTNKKFIKTIKYVIKSSFYNPLILSRIPQRMIIRKNTGLWKR